MSIFSKKTLALAVAPLLFVGVAKAETPIHSGTVMATVVKAENKPVDPKGHVIVAEVAQGTNKSTGSEAIEEGYQVLFSDILDLDKGNGKQNGVASFFEGGERTTYSYTGTITTKMVDGKPRTTGAGTWASLPGESMKGSGTYNSTVLSPTEFKVEWKGHLEKTASAQ